MEEKKPKEIPKSLESPKPIIVQEVKPKIISKVEPPKIIQTKPKPSSTKEYVRTVEALKREEAIVKRFEEDLTQCKAILDQELTKR